jgi:predicted alpha/beta hydrolase family esterase
LCQNSVLFIQGGGEDAHNEDALLVASLQRALGAEYDVRYPQMPGESEPEMQAWKAQIARELAAVDGKVILVGHSLGGSALLRYLSEESVEKPIVGLFLLAAPSWDEEKWNFDDLKLSRDLAAKVTPIARVFLYHNRDDETVPLSHLALHAARLPCAVVRESDKGGHQFAQDLAKVASDIRSVSQAAKAQR